MAWRRVATAACLVSLWCLGPSTASPATTCTARLCWPNLPGPPPPPHTTACCCDLGMTSLSLSLSDPSPPAGWSTLKVCPRITPSRCSSGCCLTHRSSPLPCGRSWTGTASRWWASSWTVSLRELLIWHPPAILSDPSFMIHLSFVHHLELCVSPWGREV